MGLSAAAVPPPPAASLLVHALVLALADELGDVGPGPGPGLVSLLDVQACEEIRHLGRMKPMSCLEDGRHCLELSLVLGAR